MGINDRQPEKNKKGRSGSEGVAGPSRLAQLLGADEGKVRQGDWGGCDPRWMQAVVVAVTRLGGLVSFGLSRDGNAHSVSIVLDGDRVTKWADPDADLDAFLEQLFHAFETA